MKIAYHGAGYVGLTGALHYARAGKDDLTIVLYDPDQAVVDAINSGRPKAGSFLGYLGAEALRLGSQVKATTILDDVLDADCHILAVPSEKRGEPNMDVVASMFSLLCDTAREDTPIIVESTVMPGVAKRLRKYVGESKRPWAIAPRRDWFADETKNLATLTRIVGIDSQHHAAISPWITLVCRDVHWTSPETAEITKALENALLHLPVMLIHELALLFPDYDIVEAAELASTHWRFKSMGKLYLGLGTGGRCVPTGSRYLSERGGALLSDAIELDEQFASEALARALLYYGKADINFALVLGVAYRPGFKDAGNSPGLRVAKAMKNLTLYVTDPYFTVTELGKLLDEVEVFHGVPFDWALIKPENQLLYNLIVLTVAHPEFADLWKIVKPGAIVVDATGMWEGKRTDWTYIRPGRPGWIPTENSIKETL